jgi:hypothetical protein
MIEIFVGLGLAGLLGQLLTKRYGRRWTSDLGVVSNRWVAEHRLSETSRRD